MTPLAGGTLVLGAALLGWIVAAHTALRRAVPLGKPPVAALAVVLGFVALHPPAATASAILLGGVFVAAVCDARTGLIFTPLAQLLGMAVLAAATLNGRPATAAAGTLAVGGALFALHALTSGRGLGLGDVRLGCAVGAGLGPAAGMAALGWAFVLGGAYGFTLLAIRRATRTTTIRFAPFIAAGTFAATLTNAAP